ncbi:MAG: presenilin family intramembrane aspartyl protease, partial [Nanoarchaeota archaeon]
FVLHAAQIEDRSYNSLYALTRTFADAHGFGDPIPDEALPAFKDIHNFTEVFIYTGITILILPFLNLFSGLMLLAFISIYDMIAVWKSKHMIKLAKFQTKSKLFAGLLLTYPTKKRYTKIIGKPNEYAQKKKVEGGKTAILGGGDIAFPLMFSSAVMEHLIIVDGLQKQLAFIQSIIVSVFVTIALIILLIKSEKGKFYPAMPFLSIGCLIGYLVVWIVF